MKIPKMFELPPPSNTSPPISLDLRADLPPCPPSPPGFRRESPIVFSLHPGGCERCQCQFGWKVCFFGKRSLDPLGPNFTEGFHQPTCLKKNKCDWDLHRFTRNYYIDIDSRNGITITHLAVLDPEKKRFERLIFPTKYVIPKSLKFSHWPRKIIYLCTLVTGGWNLNLQVTTEVS